MSAHVRHDTVERRREDVFLQTHASAAGPQIHRPHRAGRAVERKRDEAAREAGETKDVEAVARLASAWGPGDATVNVAAARERWLRLQGDRIAREAGLWVRVVEVEAAWKATTRTIRGALGALPARLAGRCGLSREACEMADHEIRDALTETCERAGRRRRNRGRARQAGKDRK